MTLIRDANAMRKDVETRAENGVVSGEVESVIATGMDEADVARLLAWPHSNVCSDGMLNGPHPRGFGAFSRVLAKYVRGEHVLTLEDAVRKMTSLAAEHAGLMRRGTIAPGNYADLVMFDPATVQDRSSPKNPHLTSSGITAVWVNGRPVWHEGRATGERPGRVLKRQSAGAPRRAPGT
jgi:N-acyl-D-amino-acid deacylase